MASSAALKQAGVGKGVKEAEQIMTELDEQLRESSELTSVLEGQLQDDGDLDEEFEELLRDHELAPLPEKPVTRPVLVNRQEEPEEPGDADVLVGVPVEHPEAAASGLRDGLANQKREAHFHGLAQLLLCYGLVGRGALQQVAGLEQH